MWNGFVEIGNENLKTARTKRYAAIKNGVHADEYLMVRYGR